MIIPLDINQDWTIQKYRNITPNEFVSHNDGLLIKVRSSASPLIYPFQSGLEITGFSVRGEVRGEIKLSSQQRQGEEGADDFHFRLGIVEAGETRLNFAEKIISAAWIKNLFSLAPKNAGINRIEFYNLSYDEKIQWQTRSHPLSSLLRENIVSQIENEGPFKMDVTLAQSTKIWGLWISSDGDDTKKDFDVMIEEIVLKTTNQ